MGKEECSFCGKHAPRSEIRFIDKQSLDISLLEKAAAVLSQAWRIHVPVYQESRNQRHTVCPHCFKCIKKNSLATVPLFSFANGTWIGAIPPKLQGLLFVEEQCIAWFMICWYQHIRGSIDKSEPLICWYHHMVHPFHAYSTFDNWERHTSITFLLTTVWLLLPCCESIARNAKEQERKEKNHALVLYVMTLFGCVCVHFDNFADFAHVEHVERCQKKKFIGTRNEDQSASDKLYRLSGSVLHDPWYFVWRCLAEFAFISTTSLISPM